MSYFKKKTLYAFSIHDRTYVDHYSIEMVFLSSVIFIQNLTDVPQFHWIVQTNVRDATGVHIKMRWLHVITFSNCSHSVKLSFLTFKLMKRNVHLLEFKKQT